MHSRDLKWKKKSIDRLYSKTLTVTSIERTTDSINYMPNMHNAQIAFPFSSVWCASSSSLHVIVQQLQCYNSAYIYIVLCRNCILLQCRKSVRDLKYRQYNIQCSVALSYVRFEHHRHFTICTWSRNYGNVIA